MTAITNNEKMLVREIKIIAIGVSTGGPSVLQTIIANLNDDFPPILIVQHISPGFLFTMVDWLKNSTGKNIHIATKNEMIQRDCIYFAPDGCHMGISRAHTILLSNDPAENSIRPSVSYLFRMVNKIFADKALAILLTGMGHDGVKELKELKDNGAITVAQDKASSVVHGMAGDAIALDAAKFILNPLQISELIKNINKR